MSRLGREVRGAAFVASAVWIMLALVMAAVGAVDAVGGFADWSDIAAAAGCVAVVGGMVGLSSYDPAPKPTPRFGFLLVVMLWFTAPIAGAAPFLLYGLCPTDAVFESVSGFTTTGSTVMVGLDTTPPGILLWRSLLQWIGGIGILALGLVLLPYLRVGGMQLFAKESSDRSDKTLPRFASFSRALVGVYVIATALCAMAYSAAGLSGFDAVNHAMATLSTGGYSTYDASMGHFEGVGPLWVGSAFMIVGALPFSLYVAALVGRRSVDLDPQVPVFLAIVAMAALSLMIVREGGLESRAAAEAVFNVVSIITTTGFAASDYGAWGPYAVALFFLLTFLGGCAGSTSGGIKTYRMIVVASLLRTHLRRLASPNAVSLTRYGRRQVDPAVFRSALVFLGAFAVTLMALTLMLAATGLDFLTAHTSALTALTNVGPGLGPIVGPVGNFSSLPDAAKWIMCLGMILGRLEILPVLVVLTPDFWER